MGARTISLPARTVQVSQHLLTDTCYFPFRFVIITLVDIQCYDLYFLGIFSGAPGHPYISFEEVSAKTPYASVKAGCHFVSAHLS